MIEVAEKPILAEQVVDRLKTSASGSIVTHTAIIRPSSEGKKVVAIEYRANKSDAERELAEIASDIRGKWEIEDVALVRRTGKLTTGDVILMAAIAAPHRKEAFRACAEAVERLRSMTSITKEEIFEPC